MSYQTKSAYQTTVNGDFTSGIDKWTGAEVQNAFLNLSDSVDWTDQAFTISFTSSFSFDCNNGRLQVITLAGNATMAISNAVIGRVYVLKVIQNGTGGWTLNLPTSKTNGQVISGVANAVSLVSFFYDGTNYLINIGQYS